MTTTEPPYRAMLRARVYRAVARAADQHESVSSLLDDLDMCALFLRIPCDSIERLSSYGSPASTELCAALRASRTAHPRYDDLIVSDLVRDAAKEIARAEERM